MALIFLQIFYLFFADHPGNAAQRGAFNLKPGQVFQLLKSAVSPDTGIQRPPLPQVLSSLANSSGNEEELKTEEHESVFEGTSENLRLQEGGNQFLHSLAS